MPLPVPFELNVDYPGARTGLSGAIFLELVRFFEE